MAPPLELTAPDAGVYGDCELSRLKSVGHVMTAVAGEMVKVTVVDPGAYVVVPAALAVTAQVPAWLKVRVPSTGSTTQPAVFDGEFATV